MSIKTVAVTGGNGFLGRAVIETLNRDGYNTVNLARGKARHDEADAYITTDLLDAGDVYGSVAKSDPDAIIHTGTIPGPRHHPRHVTYESNVMSSFYLLEAASELDLHAVALASSINAIGSSHQDAPADIRYLPVDESHPATPQDCYGVAKDAIERTADGFGRRDDSPQVISSLRYPWIADDDALNERFVEADRSLQTLTEPNTFQTRDVLFSYVHVADAAEATIHAIEAEYEGHERFWVTAGDTSAEVASETLVKEFYPTAMRQRSLENHESLIALGKAQDLLDWSPSKSWRDL